MICINQGCSKKRIDELLCKECRVEYDWPYIEAHKIMKKCFLNSWPHTCDEIRLTEAIADLIRGKTK